MDSVPAEITGKMLVHLSLADLLNTHVLLEESSSDATAFIVKMRMKVYNIQTLDHHIYCSEGSHIKKFLEDAKLSDLHELLGLANNSRSILETELNKIATTVQALN